MKTHESHSAPGDTCHLAFGVSGSIQGLVQGDRQTQLTQVKTQLDVVFCQTLLFGYPIQKKCWGVEIEPNLDFHARHQGFIQLKDIGMGFEDQGVNVAIVEMDLLFLGQQQCSFLGPAEGTVMSVG